MSDHFKTIYQSRAEDYERLISYEDYEGNILAALHEIHPLSDAVVVEFGAGTGRLTRLLSSQVRKIYAFDAEQHMLDMAQRTLAALGLPDNWHLAVADNAHVPAPDGEADIAIEGWSFGHATGWYGDAWQATVDRYLAEMMRVLQPAGTAILLETMGTGSEQPAAPTPDLRAFYDYLEAQDFSYRWIRTDYKFSSVAVAVELASFFFGDALGEAVKSPILPECTGIWWRQKA